MVVVIADDFTGAAEMAGIALTKQFSVEIVTSLPLKTEASVVVISTDTRSLPEEEAKLKLEEVAQFLQEIKPSFLFKKIDSVLRGHIVAETEVLLNRLSFAKALLVPANPSLGRTIRDGHYFVQNVPICETSFAKDPEFAMTSSLVTNMIKNGTAVQVAKCHEALPEEGIVIGEATCEADVFSWVNQVQSNTLMVGAGDFFKALLENISSEKNDTSEAFKILTDKVLYVSGTTFEGSVTAIKKTSLEQGNVSYLPVELFTEVNKEALLHKWAREITQLMSQHDKVIIAFGELTEFSPSPSQLAQWMAAVVKEVLSLTSIDSLLIEGGATAAAIMKKLALSRFIPTKVYAPGIIQMKCLEKSFYLTIKPGSYAWSKDVWEF